jgi:hypothetical protein
MTFKKRNLLGAIYYGCIALGFGIFPYLGVPVPPVSGLGITFHGEILTDIIAFLGFLMMLVQLYAFKLDWSDDDINLHLIGAFIILFAAASTAVLFLYFIGAPLIKFFDIPWWIIIIFFLWINHVLRLRKPDK